MLANAETKSLSAFAKRYFRFDSSPSEAQRQCRNTIILIIIVIVA